MCNLEGGIVAAGEASLQNQIVFNDISVLDLLESLNVKVVSLANNHIFDVQTSPVETINKLTQREILFCGAGDNISEASRPLVCDYNNEQYVFLAFGWEVISCQTAKINSPGVNPLDPRHVIKSLKSAKKNYPKARIVLLMHWNYELEIYPQPMHRQLAFAAIDEGASAIIGCHSHCLQGIEFYKDAPIVYGLGNWYFPHGFYFDGKLTFPDFSNDQLAFEWDPTENKSFCHLFKYNPETHDIDFIEKQPWGKCTITTALTPFKNMSHQEYISWFKKNRRKRKFLPIYKDMNHHFANAIKDCVVSIRHKCIKALVQLKLKGSPN
ncbi:CapA family protein [Desulfocastanea catecholica]